MNRIGAAVLAGIFVWLTMAQSHAAEPAKGYSKKVSVTAPTRIDWTFAVSRKSMAKPPAGWLGDYDSTKQQYDLFVPANLNAKKATPLILFVSAGGSPAGWSQYESICKDRGMIFASPYNAGNECEPKKRVRIILDVLDDLRRRFRIDADRTYLTGFSGGGDIACAIAFALPEYFGGVAPICFARDLREETWLKHRVIERLSVGLISGETDFNRADVERWRGPLFKDIGVRCRFWVYPKMGHGIPDGKQLAEVVAWLEEGAADRAALAKKYPASRADDQTAFSRENWAKAMLAEAKQRLKDPETQFRGLMLAQGCMTRFEGLPAAAEAKKVLQEHEKMKEHPWEKDDLFEQRLFLLALAKAQDAYVSGPLPAQYEKERVGVAKEALELWQIIRKDAGNTKVGELAGERIRALQKIIEKGDK